VQIFAYDGRPVATLKLSGIRTEFLNYQSVSLSPDTVVVKDTFDPKSIKVFEALSGKLVTDITIQHHMEIMEICLNQFGPQLERKCALIDRNRDLYLCSVAGKSQMYKLATMVAAVKWNDYSEILVAIADGKLVVWYYPSVVFIDRDLLPKTKIIRDDAEFGRNDQLLDFFGSRVTCRRGSDGAVLTYAIKPYPIKLFAHVRDNQWEESLRLCRFVKEPALWSILAALSIKHGNLQTAEAAYANIDESDKLQYIKYIAEIPTPEGRNAELALFQRRQEDAEQILLQAGLVYRAIKMHLRLFNFERALQLAVSHKTHIDTVLGFRQKYLATFHKEETSESFLKPEIQQVEVDWSNIHQKIEKEKKDEESRPGARPYGA
jgi:intraflagellar transport protein 80